MGNPILSISFSADKEHYLLALGDNSIRVVRFDNNKLIHHIQGLHAAKLDESVLDPLTNELVVPFENKLQFYDPSNHVITSQLSVQPKNYVS